VEERLETRLLGHRGTPHSDGSTTSVTWQR
jgi:hypothetical protein